MDGFDTSTEISPLSPQEMEVMMWTACGKTSGEISICMTLSEETVRTYIKRACQKLNAVNKTHATAIALIHGLMPLGPSPKRVIPLTTIFGLTRYRDPVARYASRTKKT